MGRDGFSFSASVSATSARNSFHRGLPAISMRHTCWFEVMELAVRV